MDTKKRGIEPSSKDITKARLKIVGWITLHLIVTNQESKIVEIFKNRGIFLEHAEYIAGWHKDKKEKTFAIRMKKQVLDEVDRFLESRNNK